MKIDPNPKTILYLIGAMIGCAALFSFGSLAPKIFHYISYYKPIDVEVERIEIMELAEDFYVPHAFYTYGNYRRDEILETRAENNPYLLEERLKAWAGEKIVGYLNYHDQCTLQKCFPVKQSVYTLILISLALYFVFLGKVKV